MAFRMLRTLPVLLALCFSIIAFVFSLLAITSSDWAAQDFYDTVVPENWTHPNYTITRSPFRICTAVPIFQTNNGTSEDSEPTLTFVRYDVSCDRYKPFGLDRTSCELRSVTKTDSVANVGDARLCQQIHYAGNFGISSTVFISLGFILTLCMAMSTIYRMMTRGQASDHPSTSSGAEQYGSKSTAADSSQDVQHLSQPSRRYPHLVTSTVNLTAVIFLLIGAILALISQFYGIIGFIQSSPNNGDWASAAAGNSKDVDTNKVGYHGPWYQAEGLSVYMTCAWAFAAATAAMAAKAWSLPRWMLDH
jgi:hypothetical protein